MNGEAAVNSQHTGRKIDYLKKMVLKCLKFCLEPIKFSAFLYDRHLANSLPLLPLKGALDYSTHCPVTQGRLNFCGWHNRTSIPEQFKVPAASINGHMNIIIQLQNVDFNHNFSSTNNTTLYKATATPWLDRNCAVLAIQQGWDRVVQIGLLKS